MRHGKNIWDVAIIGGGPAGCTAAIVLARCKRKILLIDEGNQRNLRSTGMHNFPTRDGILPNHYLELVHIELKRYKVSILKNTVTAAKALSDVGFEIIDSNKRTHLARRILIATGVTDIIPDIPGMQELWGCAVFHCPYCDGWECRDKIIGLYAQRHNGYGMALALQQLSPNVIVFTDGAYYFKPWQRRNLEALHIQVNSLHVAKLIYTNKELRAVQLQTGNTIKCEAMFVLHDHQVNANLLNQLGCLCTKKGAAITNRHQQTNIPGVYVAGDASFDMHMVVVASAEGAKAGVAIHNDLLRTDHLIK